MGEIVRFPHEDMARRHTQSHVSLAPVIILPVIRLERREETTGRKGGKLRVFSGGAKKPRGKK
jgi:hypothetical protein